MLNMCREQKQCMFKYEHVKLFVTRILAIVMTSYNSIAAPAANTPANATPIVAAPPVNVELGLAVVIVGVTIVPFPELMGVTETTGPGPVGIGVVCVTGAVVEGTDVDEVDEAEDEELLEELEDELEEPDESQATTQAARAGAQSKRLPVGGFVRQLSDFALQPQSLLTFGSMQEKKLEAQKAWLALGATIVIHLC
jgi:hypothetical protein